MATLTAARPARHRLVRRPAGRGLGDFLERFFVSVSVSALPVTIVVLAVMTPGSI